MIFLSSFTRRTTRLNESLEQRRKVQTEVAAQQRHVAHLQEELRYLDSEVREAEEDLAVLRESSGIQGGSDRLGADPYMSRDEDCLSDLELVATRPFPSLFMVLPVR